MMEKEARKRKITFLKTQYHPGDTVPVSAIYECSECWSVTAFKKGETFQRCEDCKEPADGQHWLRTNQFIHFVSKNLNTEFENMETFGIRLSDWVAEYVGSWKFIILFGVFMSVWIYVNIYAWGHAWDPYPFILLNLILSTIAAIQAPLIMMSQNRQGAKSELRAELDYQTNLKTEKDVAEVLAILHDLRQGGKLIQQQTSEILEETQEMQESHRTQKKRKRKAGKAREGDSGTSIS